MNKYARVFFVFGAAWCSLVCAQETFRIPLPDSSIVLTKNEFVQLDTTEFPVASCGTFSGEERFRAACGKFDLMGTSDGPQGSFRVWRVEVGIAQKGFAHPFKGFCFLTSTAGWRHFGSFSFFDDTLKAMAFKFFYDVDGDSAAEFIRWSSFALHPEATNAEYPLVAWVYRVDSGGNLRLSMPLSRQIAIRLADAYYRRNEKTPDAIYLRAERLLRRFAQSTPHNE